MGAETRRGKVWLAVSGLVISKDHKWLVVKKKYGGLKGQWSLPAGFVESGETADEAVIREVAEETGIKCTVQTLIGLRTGVIEGEISDNMILFLLKPEPDQEIIVQERELFDVQYMDPVELEDNEECSVLLKYILHRTKTGDKPLRNGINPGDQFGYTAYRLFL